MYTFSDKISEPRQNSVWTGLNEKAIVSDYVQSSSSEHEACHLMTVINPSVCTLWLHQRTPDEMAHPSARLINGCASEQMHIISAYKLWPIKLAVSFW